MVAHVAKRLIDYGKISLVGVIGGLFTWSAFPRTNLWVGAIVGLSLLLYIVDNKRIGLVLWGTFVWGISYMLPLISWAEISVGWPGPWIALTIIEVLFICAWAVVAHILSTRITRPFVWIILVTLLFTGFEQLRGFYPFGGFPWGFIAHSQVNAPYNSLIAIGGEVLVTTFTMLMAGTVYRIIHGRRRILLVTVLIPAMVAASLIPYPTPTSHGSTTLAIIQGNVDPPVEKTFSTPLKVFNNHVRQTHAALNKKPKPDIVLWGEQASDRDFRLDERVRPQLEELADRYDLPIVFGTIYYFTKDGVRLRTNDLAIVEPHGAPHVLYTKQFPVPFGEYVPMRDFLGQYFADVKRIGVDMVGGNKPPLITVGTVPIAVGICFEVALDNVMYEGVNRGGRLIVIPTNNSSFGYSSQAEQQLDILRFRAIEYGRTSVQVSVNGVSAVVDYKGDITHDTHLFVADDITAKVPLFTHRTPASYWAAPAGWYWAHITLGLSVLIVIYGLFKGLKPRKKKRKK